MRTSTVVTVAVLLAACGPRSEPAEAGPEDRTCLTGQVLATGADPFPEVLLRPDDGSQEVLLSGEQAQIAQRLTGATIAVCGPIGMERGRRAVEVREIDMRSVDGMDAHLGVLERAPDGWRLVGETDPAEIDLAGSTVTAALAEAEGRLVWVAGVWRADSFAVQSFGVVR